MAIIYECECCGDQGDDELFYCGGDACHNNVCGNCCKKCKDPTCVRRVCTDCLDKDQKYIGNVYCIKHAMWDGQFKNFDYVKHKLTHKQGLKLLHKECRKKRDKYVATAVERVINGSMRGVDALIEKARGEAELTQKQEDQLTRFGI